MRQYQALFYLEKMENLNKTIESEANKRYITGHRNKVMMQIMFNLGLRLAEVINLKWDDIDFLSEVLMIREGKGMKDRTLYVKIITGVGMMIRRLFQAIMIFKNTFRIMLDRVNF